MLKNLWVEYWIVQLDGGGKFGPFTSVHEAHECVVKEELSDYELKTVLSYIPF